MQKKAESHEAGEDDTKMQLKLKKTRRAITCLCTSQKSSYNQGGEKLTEN